jgi:hypothetical protein
MQNFENNRRLETSRNMPHIWNNFPPRICEMTIAQKNIYIEVHIYKYVLG